MSYNSRPEVSRGGKAMAWLVIVAAVIIALVMAAGCKGKNNETQASPTDTQRTDTAVSADASVEDTVVPEEVETPTEVMKVYHLEVLGLPSTGQPRAGVVVTSENGNDTEFVYLNAIDGNRNLFYFQAPSRANVSFQVTIVFNKGECHRPSESIYCGRVKLFAGSQAEADANKLPEVEVNVVPVLPGVDSERNLPQSQPEKCDMFLPVERLEKGEPLYCMYEPQ